MSSKNVPLSPKIIQRSNRPLHLLGQTFFPVVVPILLSNDFWNGETSFQVQYAAYVQRREL